MGGVWRVRKRERSKLEKKIRDSDSEFTKRSKKLTGTNQKDDQHYSCNDKIIIVYYCRNLNRKT